VSPFYIEAHFNYVFLFYHNYVSLPLLLVATGVSPCCDIGPWSSPLSLFTCVSRNGIATIDIHHMDGSLEVLGAIYGEPYFRENVS
jgi:hypothetical protein